MKRIAASFLATVLVIVPMSVRPLGLGEIDLRSHLNEPLAARIPLYSLAGVEVDSIRLTLGTTEQFRRAGVERLFHLNSLRFAVHGEGPKAYIGVTSRQAIVEPFLNFLLEVNWSNGRVLREYTLLLDPPVYGAASTTYVKDAVATVNAPPSLNASGSAARATAVTPTGQGPVARAGGGLAPGGTYGPVRSTDTLWSLADRFRGSSDVSIQQTMLAMLRLNPDAFLESNVNLLREGAVLRIPTRDQPGELARSDALAEVQRQHAAWQDFRRSIGARVVAAPQGAGASSAPSQPNAAATNARPDASSMAASDGEADGVLKLVSAGAASGGVGTSSGDSAEISSLRSELDSARDEADASRREAEDLAARVEETEAIIQELERLVKLRDADLAALQDQLQTSAAKIADAQQPQVSAGAASDKAGSAPAQKTPGQSSASTPAPKQLPPVPLPAPTASEEPTGVLALVRSALGDIVPFDPILLIGGAILVIVIAVVGIVFSRRRKSEGDDVAAPQAVRVERAESQRDFDADSTQITTAGRGEDAPVTGVAEVPVDDAPVEEDWAGDLPVEEQPTQRREAEDDPFAEVNVYLAYERFEQAESLVNDAIDKHPDRSDSKLKLLEIHHAAKNASAFTSAALLLQGAVGDDHPMMETAREWWGSISPGTELFSGDPDLDGLQTQVGMTIGDDDIFDVTTEDDGPQIPIGAAETTTQLSGGVDMAQGVDFDLGLDFGADDTEALTGEGTNIDFDLGLADGEPVGSDTGLDFDLTEIGDHVSRAPATDIGADTGLDFDLEDLGGDDLGANTGLDVGPGEGGIVLPIDDSMEFEATTIGEDTDLDFALDDHAVARGDSGGVEALDFVLDDPTELGTEAADDSLHGAAETDLAFDLDLGEETGVGDDTPVSPGADSGLDLVLEDDGASGAGEEETNTDADFDIDFDLSEFGDAPGDVGGDIASADNSTALNLDTSGVGVDTDLDLDIDLDSHAETSEIPRNDSETAPPADLEFDLEIPGESDTGGAGLDFDFASLDATDDAEDEIGTVEMSPADPNRDTGGLEVPELEADAGLDFALDIPDETITGDGLVDGIFDVPDADGADTAVLDFDVGPGGVSDGGGLSIDEDFADLFGGDDDGASVAGLTHPGLDYALDDGSGTAADGGITDSDLDALFTSEEDEPASDLSIDAVPISSDDEITDLNLDLDLVEPPAVQDSALDFDLGAFGHQPSAETSEGLDIDFDGFELDDSEGELVEPIDDEHEFVDLEGEAGEDRTLVLGRSPDGEVDEIQTKLDLAHAYMDMGDQEGAKGILAEVMSEGNDAQRGQAEGLLKSIG